LVDDKIIIRNDKGIAGKLALSLTLNGWQRYEELKRSVKDSRKAFVAMEFFDPDKKDSDYFFQTELLDKYLVPAVKQTEFELSNPLASNPKAGNLHARLEVEIRNARFVVAELSHANDGAYWEAGFARGLGKPVIYMYNKEIGGRDRPHFDVGSDQIIFWEKDKPERAAQALKDIIRATLFGEAKQAD
jgi:nucleoside 2-deoxyribosyltransferase